MKTDFDNIKVQIENGVAVLTMDNPPVNQLSEHFALQLMQAISEGFQDSNIKAIVLTGTGKNFVAGADLTQIYKIYDKERIQIRSKGFSDFLNQIEMGPKPVIAAINGNALGGGLELAMACHYRISTKGAQHGQPEVMVGLIPGAGGTQRLPRLIGLPNALEMITVGRPIDAEKALSRRLVDEVTDPEKLISAAVAAAEKFVSGKISLESRRTRYRYNRLPSAAELKAMSNGAKFMAMQKARGYLAPFKAIEAIEKGLTFNIEADIDREIDLFADCGVSHISKNLIGIFLNTRSAGRLPRIENITPAEIKNVAMLGGGVMGSGIVNLLLSGGYNVVLWDINQEALDKGVASIKKTFDYALKKKKMTPDALDSIIQGRLKTTRARG